jgi:phytoene/squalene synthetase
MAVGHYENFPVASLLLPAELRAPIEVIYRFARSADDFADEGADSPDIRLGKLNRYRAELERVARGMPLIPPPESFEIKDLFRRGRHAN